MRPDDVRKAIEEIERAGIAVMQSAQLLKDIKSVPDPISAVAQPDHAVL